MSKSVRRGDSFSFSSSSVVARNSSDRSHKPPRFSLRRFFCRHPSSARSMARVVQSQSEIESQSLSSLQTSFSERETSAKAAYAEDSHAVYKKSKDGMECPVCLTCQPKENFPVIMTCHHRSCVDCLRKYLRIEITESRVNIACPECNEKFHPNDIKMILDDNELLLKYEEFMLRRVLVLDPDTRWCPAPDCGYAVIASGCASCPRIKCEMPGCNTYFCYHCKQYWHPNQTCDTARAERSSNLRSSSLSYSHESGWQNDIKPCPRCSAFIVKMDDGSCNHMTCAVCGAEFCWLCMKEISDLHYLSPSGCTFWGKKPWSRKKKILWQLGTLVGAPVGITLIAGVAVPAIIIGVPVWVGKRLHSRYEYLPKHRRNLVVASGVMASILVSPILAGLAVGIGVPILLAYVYGVVPISLCRSGGCGVTTTNSGGVRFDFDDNENGQTGATMMSPGGDTQSVETNIHNVANPSIGPSIGEMSMAMTNSLLSASGSHLDRVGVLRDDLDRESASNRAVNGSISSSTVAGSSTYHNRLEIQADVSTQPSHKRNSISSESANFSLDAKSATVSFGDDASTRALAGSLCCRDRDSSSAVIPPLEVQVDVGEATAHYRGEEQKSMETVADSKLTSKEGSPMSNESVSFVIEDMPNVMEQSGPSNQCTLPGTSNGSGLGGRMILEEVRRSPRASVSFVDDFGADGGLQNCDTSSHHDDSTDPGDSSPGSTFTIESLTCHQMVAPLASFTEVESDRPSCPSDFSSDDPGRDSSSESLSTGIISVIQKTLVIDPEVTEPKQNDHFRDDDSLMLDTSEKLDPTSTNNSSDNLDGGDICTTSVTINGVFNMSSTS